MTDPSRWQREVDGYPSADYFLAVADELRMAGIDISEMHRPYVNVVDIKLAPESYRDGPIGWADGLWLSWRTNALDRPTDINDFTGIGWCWIPYSTPATSVAREFDGLAYLAEPGDVAAAVADLFGVGRPASIA